MAIAEFTPSSALLGGALIGLAANLLLFSQGRIAGISGILGGLLSFNRGDVAWRAAFLGGMIAAGLLFGAVAGNGLVVELQSPLALTLIAGLIVGYGTRVGGGCTSGHGVCGIARLSPRSITATVIFMGTAFVTVFVLRHVLGA